MLATVVMLGRDTTVGRDIGNREDYIPGENGHTAARPTEDVVL